MSTDVGSAVTADVRVSDKLDHLVVTPRRSADRHRVNGLLREKLPEADIRPTSNGACLLPVDAGTLLGVDGGVDLRWRPEARLFAENRHRVQGARNEIHELVNGVLSGGRHAAEGRLPDVKGELDVLDDHQVVNVAAMTVSDGYGMCVFDEQGAGKTVTQIFAFDVLVDRDEVDFALIVAPKSMVPEWPRDFERFKGGLYKVGVVTGSRKEKRGALASGADVLVTNFETVVSMEQEVQALLSRYQGRAVLIVDESFYAKSLDAKRTRSLRRLRERCGRAFVLCGTPAPNSPHDLVQQFNLVDFGLTFAGVEVPKDRSEARPVVKRAIEERGIYARHLKSDVLPALPPKAFNRVLLSLQPEQEEAYAAALDDLILDLRSVDESEFRRHLTSFLARRSALLQICSNPAPLIKGYSETPTKLLALDDLLEELILRRDEKVVLWSFYTASIQSIVTRYSKFSPARYDGSVSDVGERREAVRKFQEDDETMLFVANPAAAGAGLTLHRAHYAVYESMSNQAAHYLQSLDRIHRRGQEREVEYFVLLCERTIEVNEYERLTGKERDAQSLLGDQVEQPVTKEALLNEILTSSRLLEKG